MASPSLSPLSLEKKPSASSNAKSSIARAQSPRHGRKTLANFLGGATSGCISTLLLQPLDVIKTRMQMSSAFNRSVNLQQALSIQSNTGVWRTFRTIVAQDSIAGLWRGVVPTFVRNSLGVGLYFVTLSSITSFAAKRDSRSQDGALSNRVALFAGAFSRSFAVCMLCPLSVVKTRMETIEYANKYSGVLNALASIARKEGPRGLFAGLVPAIVRDAPYSALYMLIYLRTKQHIGALVGIKDNRSKINNSSPSNASSLPEPPNKGLLMSVNFVSGAFGGGLATLLTQPQDVIKTRMQLTQRHIKGANRYGTVRESARRIFAEEGMYGFFRGSSARVLKRMLGSALTWMLYEELVTYYQRMLKSKTLLIEEKPVEETKVAAVQKKTR